MNYKAAIFDMDGTILNTLEDLVDTMNHCLRLYDMPERSQAEIRSFLGNGLRVLVEKSVPFGTQAEVVDRICETFADYYKDHCAIKTRPYEGITDLLQRLRSEGILTAVVSNKVDFAVRELCEDYFEGLFDYSVGEREGQRCKPYPDSVNAVLDFFRLSKEQAVYIGDSEVDFMTAKNADMDVIMVGWGFRDESELAAMGAEFIAHSMNDVYEAIVTDK